MKGIIVEANILTGRVTKVTHVEGCSPSQLEPGQVFLPGNPDVQPGHYLHEAQKPAGQILWIIGRLTRSGGECSASCIFPWCPWWPRKTLLASVRWLEEVGLIKCRLAEDGYRFYSLNLEH